MGRELDAYLHRQRTRTPYLVTTMTHVYKNDRRHFTDNFPTVDAFLAAPLMGRLSLVLRGENLTDETIITRNQGGSIDLGVPRTIWLGLRYGF
jgi:outer membrane receptor for ferric coprogen and ferric-rhodotorulic acid